MTRYRINYELMLKDKTTLPEQSAVVEADSDWNYARQLFWTQDLKIPKSIAEVLSSVSITSMWVLRPDEEI